MKVLIIGWGGREHALAWKVAQSPLVDQIYVAPGNGGTEVFCQNVAIEVKDAAGLAEFATSERIDLTIVGRDDSLAAGVVDQFQARDLPILGPTKAAFAIESSKAFAKGLMKKQGIPTAAYTKFVDHQEAAKYLKVATYPLVIKASGLAGGKGVVICHDLTEAQRVLHQIMVERIFGEAGREVVLEEFVPGEEISIHALSDGRSFSLFPASRDHKPIGEGNRGPNTGGMGTYAPVDDIDLERVADQVVDPALKALVDAGRPFVGCLYPGLKGADFKVIEYNGRFGDPEAQAYLRLLDSDLVELTQACLDQKLDNYRLRWSNGYAVCLVLVSGGYPGDYQTGFEISGLADAESDPAIVIFHAGTRLEKGHLVTAGGRVLNVTATAPTLAEAAAAAYRAAAKIKFKDCYYRRDIGRPWPS